MMSIFGKYVGRTENSISHGNFEIKMKRPPTSDLNLYGSFNFVSDLEFETDIEEPVIPIKFTINRQSLYLQFNALPLIYSSYIMLIPFPPLLIAPMVCWFFIHTRRIFFYTKTVGEQGEELYIETETNKFKIIMYSIFMLFDIAAVFKIITEPHHHSFVFTALVMFVTIIMGCVNTYQEYRINIVQRGLGKQYRTSVEKPKNIYRVISTEEIVDSYGSGMDYGLGSGLDSINLSSMIEDLAQQSSLGFANEVPDSFRFVPHDLQLSELYEENEVEHDYISDFEFVQNTNSTQRSTSSDMRTQVFDSMLFTSQTQSNVIKETFEETDIEDEQFVFMMQRSPDLRSQNLTSSIGLSNPTTPVIDNGSLTVIVFGSAEGLTFNNSDLENDSHEIEINFED
ncbi:hypothetical protein PCE1_004382 [Barthelona sp. PCE]